jgi:hypothetical protein
LSIKEFGASAFIVALALRREKPSTDAPATFCEVVSMPACAIFKADIAESVIE